MSKYAVEAFSDSLAFEMGTVGVHVSVIEPGPYNSSAVASSCRRRREQGYDPAGSLFEQLAAELATLCDGDGASQFPQPDAVADVVLHALFSEEPKNRYLAVTDRRHAEGVMRSVVETLVELSANGHSFEFSRDDLVRMLDDALLDSGGD